MPLPLSSAPRRPGLLRLEPLRVVARVPLFLPLFAASALRACAIR